MPGSGGSAGASIMAGLGKLTTSSASPLNSSTSGYVGNAAKSPSISYAKRRSVAPIPSAYSSKSRWLYAAFCSVHLLR